MKKHLTSFVDYALFTTGVIVGIFLPIILTLYLDLSLGFYMILLFFINIIVALAISVIIKTEIETSVIFMQGLMLISISIFVGFYFWSDIDSSKKDSNTILNFRLDDFTRSIIDERSREIHHIRSTIDYEYLKESVEGGICDTIVIDTIEQKLRNTNFRIMDKKHYGCHIRKKEEQ